MRPNGRPATSEVLPECRLRFGHREPAVQCRSAHPKQRCDLLHRQLPRRPQRTRRSQLLGRHHGRPAPNRPRARAASSPARVRSSTSARSNSASAAKICRVRRPAAVVVSRPSVNDRNPTSRCSRSPIVSIRCRSDRPNRSSRQTTTCPRAQIVQARIKLRTMTDRPRPPVVIDPSTARPRQRVALQRQVLAGGRHPRVANELPDRNLLAHTPRTPPDHIVSDRSSLSHARPSQNQTFLERGKLRPRSSDSVRADAGVWAVESAR